MFPLPLAPSTLGHGALPDECHLPPLCRNGTNLACIGLFYCTMTHIVVLLVAHE